MRLIGKIKWYKEKLGVGYVIGIDGELYHFELCHCLGNNYIYKADDIVSFTPVSGSIDYAINIKLMQ